MHVSMKDVVASPGHLEELRKELNDPDFDAPVGTHILTNLVEADGAFELAAQDAKFEARVISVQRTPSGGIRVQTAVFVNNPKPKPKPVVDPNADVFAYLSGKGITGDEAKKFLEKFGLDRVRAKMAEEAKEVAAKLDAEMEKTLG